MTITYLIASQSEALNVLAQYSAPLADTVQIPSVVPPGSEKFMRLPGVVKWAVTLIGVTMLIVSAGVMAVEKFTDHSVGNKGPKIALYALIGGIVCSIAPQLYGFATA